MNWSDPNENISKYFKVKEALFLPKWGIFHQPNESEQMAISLMAERMDIIREYIEKPIIVLSWIRPDHVNCPGSEYHLCDYNDLVNGAPSSMHIYGSAVDWYCSDSCDIVRFNIQFKLEQWGIRMERLPMSNWIHVDNKTVSQGMQRYFIP